MLVLKRFTEDRFRWPRREIAVVTLSIEQLYWILEGLDIEAMVRVPVAISDWRGACRAFLAFAL